MAYSLVHLLLIGAVLFGAFKLYSWWASRADPVQKKPNVVYLYQFERWKHNPNLSQFCLKLETFLRLAKIPHVCMFTLTLGKKGKMPYIEYNGEQLCDSEEIIHWAKKKFSVNLDGDMDDVQLAANHFLKVMVNEHTYWGIVYNRWIDRFDILLPEFSVAIPQLLSRFIIGPSVKKYLYGQGLGRHTPEEIYDIIKRDIVALSNRLGSAPFFGGEQPTEVDCSTFACLVSLIWSPFPCPVRDFALTKPNLLQYMERMKTRVFPDWDHLPKHGEEWKPQADESKSN